MMPQGGAWPEAAPHRLSAASWFTLTFSLIVIGLSLTQSLYRLSLPWDGWNFTRDVAGSGQRLIFNQYLVAGSSPLHTGDVLSAVEGQPYNDILARALTGEPELPDNWHEGGTARYTVLRDGVETRLVVSLVRLTPLQILSTLGRSWLQNPGPLLALLLALVVFFGRPDQIAARLLLLFSACVFSSDGISQAVNGSNIVGVAELFYRGAYWPAGFFNSLIWSLLIGPLYLHLFLTFPVVKKPMAEHPLWTRVLLYGFTPFFILLAAGLSNGSPLDFWSTWGYFSFINLIATLSIAILSAVHTLLTAHDPIRQAQIRWVTWGTLLTSVGALNGGILAALGLLGQNWLVDYLAFRLLYMAFPLSAAIAILRYQLFEIDILIRRTLIYGLLTGILAMVYLSSVVLLEQVLRPFIGENSDLAVIVCTLAIAALFTPLRRRIQQVIDLRFYRSKYDAAQVLAAFNATVRDEVEVEKLRDHLLVVVSETIKPEHVSLWLKRPTDGHNQWVGQNEGVRRG
jgi:hypothetical protein